MPSSNIINLTKQEILGVGITVDSEERILEYVEEILTKTDKKLSIVTPNPEILVRAFADTEFKRVLNGADIALPDGIGVILGGQLLGKKLKSRIAGVDFMEKVCSLTSRLNTKLKNSQKSASEVSKQLVTTGFLGGQPGVAEKAAECLRNKYPGVSIGFTKNEVGEATTLPPVDVLFVAFGAPRQEKWIYENLKKNPIRIAMAVGGSFDFLSGNVIRAPKLIQNIGLEWLFRLVIQPWRWKRQLALLKFLRLILLEKFSHK
jgi:N-acetylglucosaminyldiphosphoundecaprenol N-acetyl-beta-D-mannosaminyltransferase